MADDAERRPCSLPQQKCPTKAQLRLVARQKRYDESGKGTDRAYRRPGSLSK